MFKLGALMLIIPMCVILVMLIFGLMAAAYQAGVLGWVTFGLLWMIVGFLFMVAGK